MKKETIIKLTITNTIDRVQQSVPNKEQMIWVEERIVNKIMNVFRVDMKVDFSWKMYEKPEKDNEYVIEITKTED